MKIPHDDIEEMWTLGLAAAYGVLILAAILLTSCAPVAAYNATVSSRAVSVDSDGKSVRAAYTVTYR